MKRFKIGQTVYYYRTFNNAIGDIVKCTVKKVTKDLSSKKIIYAVSSDEFFYQSTIDMTSDYLYPTLKAITKDHKDEIAYGYLLNRITELEKSLNKVIDNYAEKIEANPTLGISIDTTSQSHSLIIDGIGNVQEEFDKLKKEVANIKKKIKKPSKKTVVKKD